MAERSGFIPKHGGYRRLISFQRAEWVFDATNRFCARFLKSGDRTIGQMVQVARAEDELNSFPIPGARVP